MAIIMAIIINYEYILANLHADETINPGSSDESAISVKTTRSPKPKQVFKTSRPDQMKSQQEN